MGGGTAAGAPPTSHPALPGPATGTVSGPADGRAELRGDAMTDPTPLPADTDTLIDSPGLDIPGVVEDALDATLAEEAATALQTPVGPAEAAEADVVEQRIAVPIDEEEYRG